MDILNDIKLTEALTRCKLHAKYSVGIMFDNNDLTIYTVGGKKKFSGTYEKGKTLADKFNIGKIYTSLDDILRNDD